MANLRPRAASLRGDDFQHERAWEWCIDSLLDPTILSVHVEDPEGGSFDDITIRFSTGTKRFEQAKSSNNASVSLSFSSLSEKARPKGMSPVQHFFETWREHRGDQSEFALVSNRTIDATDPVLSLRDNASRRLDMQPLNSATSRSAKGEALVAWETHLGCDRAELLQFLADLEIITVGTNSSEGVRNKQLLAGLQHSANALTLGRSIPREWVMEGAGEQSRADIKAAIAGKELLARDGVIRFDVYAVDRRVTAMAPNEFVDLTEHFPADVDPRHRHQVSDHAALHSEVLPALRSAVAGLDAYGISAVEVGGSMRLPYWYAVGRLLSEVRGWRLSTIQTGVLWELSKKNALAPLVLENSVIPREPTAVTIALTVDAREAVGAKLRELGLESHIVLGSDLGFGVESVPDSDWLAGWARGVKEILQATIAAAPRVHLFLAAPQSAALILGHLWNQLPDVVTYEWVPGVGYVSDLEI